MLCDIKDGTYARGWIEENKAGRPEFNKIRARNKSSSSSGSARSSGR